MATANETVKKVLNHLMAKAESSLSAESGGGKTLGGLSFLTD